MQQRKTPRRLAPIAVLVATLAGAAPAHSGPLLGERGMFTASDAGKVDYFGLRSLSKDGLVALATKHEFSNCWSAYVFTRSGDTWSQQQKIPSPDSHQVCPVGVPGALSADGETALLWDWVLARAHIFVRSGNVWTLQKTLTVPGGLAGASSGTSVALSNDGHIAVIGATGDDCVVSKCGATYLFVRNGNAWTLQQKLARPEADTDYFGASVALSANGDTALIGAHTTAKRGAAYAYVRNGGTWSLQQKLAASDGAVSDNFGISVALSANGNTALVGAPGVDCVAGIFCGAGYVFVRSGTSWSQQMKFLPTGADAWDFALGEASALSADGNTALLSATGEKCASGSHCGAVFVFERAGDTWTQTQKLTPAGAKGSDVFGSAISFSGDAQRVLIGAPLRDCAAGSDCGTIYHFAVDPCLGRDGVINVRCLGPAVLVPDHWIPVGCEIIDCCPGCPGPAVIDWHIRVDGTPVDALIVRFDNLPPSMRSALRIQGSARWLDAHRLQIPGRGDVVIRGFSPLDGRELRWSATSPRMTLDRVVGLRTGQRGGRDDGAIRLRVEQRVGTVPISNSTLIYRYEP
jgi:hypothetical protein